MYGPGQAPAQQQLNAQQQMLLAMQMHVVGPNLYGDQDAPKPKPLPISDILIGEITAWRCWRVKDGFLRSTSRDDIWPTREPMDGKVESKNGGGGIYCFKNERKLLNSGVGSNGGVYGTIDIWGDIVEHDDGYRAQFARVTSIAGLVGSLGPKPDLSGLRARYGV